MLIEASAPRSYECHLFNFITTRETEVLLKRLEIPVIIIIIITTITIIIIIFCYTVKARDASRRATAPNLRSRYLQGVQITSFSKPTWMWLPKPGTYLYTLADWRW